MRAPHSAPRGARKGCRLLSKATGHRSKAPSSYDRRLLGLPPYLIPLTFEKSLPLIPL